jgi:hypothetical protein
VSLEPGRAPVQLGRGDNFGKSADRSAFQIVQTIGVALDSDALPAGECTVGEAICRPTANLALVDQPPLAWWISRAASPAHLP